MRMELLAAVLVALAFACSNKFAGQCSSDADCTPGAKCDHSLPVAVCVVPQGACFPSCATGFTCVSGACVTSTCNPPCTSSQVCDPTTITC